MRPPAQAGRRDTKGLKNNLNYSVREESSAHRRGGWYTHVRDRALHSPEVGHVRVSTQGTHDEKVQVAGSFGQWLMISVKLTSAVHEFVI